MKRQRLLSGLLMVVLVATLRGGLCAQEAPDPIALQVALAEALAKSGEAKLAVAAYEKALELVAAPPATADRATRAVPIRRALAWTRAQAGDAVGAVADACLVAQAVAAGEGPVQELEFACQAVELAATGFGRTQGFAAGDRLRRQFEALVNPETHLPLVAAISHFRGAAARELGEVEAALAAYAIAADLRRTLKDDIGLGWSLNNRAFVLMSAGRFGEAATGFAAVVPVVLRGGRDLAEVERTLCHNLQTLFWTRRSHAEGQPVAALVAPTNLALDEAKADGRFLHRAWLAALELDCLVADEAPAASREFAAARLARVGGEGGWLAHALVRQAAAVRESGAKRLPEARQLALRAQEAAKRCGDPQRAAECLFELAQVLWASGDMEGGDRAVEECLDACSQVGLLYIPGKEIQKLGADLDPAANPERAKRVQAWAERTKLITPASGGIRSPAMRPTLAAHLAEMKPDDPVCKLTYDRNRDGELLWRLEALEGEAPIEFSATGGAFWVRVPGWELLVRGAFAQVVAANDGSSNLKLEAKPIWNPIYRTICLLPGESMTLCRDGAFRP